VKALFVHGGVSGVEKKVLPDLSPAVRAGSSAPTALAMVEAAVRTLEDDPALNAGYGAVLDITGNVSLDAGIADGATGSFGAVAGVTLANPISLARRVLEKTPHSSMIGPGAMALGEDMEKVTVAPDRKAQWEEARDNAKLSPDAYGQPDKVDTVGAIALDASGNLAAGSSTGGVFGKLPGRVGDSPVFGAGFYASRRAAVVGTGVGELFLETLACARVGTLIESGVAPQEACDEVIATLGRRATTSAGLLAINSNGAYGCTYRGGSLSVFGLHGRVDPTRVD
jgi:beta-aspartyl-peptidase (threonine type)